MGPHLVILSGPPASVPVGRIAVAVEVARADRIGMTGSCAAYVPTFVAFEGVGDLVLPLADMPPLPDGIYEDCALLAQAGPTFATATLPRFEVDSVTPTLSRVDVWPDFVPSATPTIMVSANKPGDLTWSGPCRGPEQISSGVTSLQLRPAEGTAFPEGPVDGCGVVLVDGQGRYSPPLMLGEFHVAAQAPVLTLVSGPPLHTSDSRPQVEVHVTEDAGLVGGGPCFASPNWLSAGTSTVTLYGAFEEGPIEGCSLVASDVSGAQSNPLALGTFHFDQSPPTIRLIDPPLEVVNEIPVATFEVNEPVRAALAGDCEGGLDEVDGHFELALLPPGDHPEGRYRCTLTVYDRVGHAVGVVIPDFELDMSPPTLVVHSQPVGAGHRGVGLALDVEVDEPSILTLADCDLMLLQDGFLMGRELVELRGPDGGAVPRGSYKCRVWASDRTDLAGEVLQLAAFEVDRLTVTLVASPTRTRAPSVTVHSSHPVNVSVSSGYAVAPPFAEAGQIELALTAAGGGPLSDGPHSPRLVFATPSDAADFEVQVPTFTVDTRPPQVSISSQRVTPSLVEVTLHTSEPGALAVTGPCRTAAQSLAGGTVALPILDEQGGQLPDGTHVCAFSVTDAVGNASAPAEVTLVVDRGAPVLTLLAPPEASGATLTRPFQITSTRSGLLFSSGCPDGLPTQVAQGAQTLTLIGTPGDGYSRCALVVQGDNGVYSQWLFLPRFTFTGPTVVREFSDSGRAMDFSDITPLTGGGYIVVGEAPQHGYVGRLDPMMQVVWMKQLMGLRPLAAAVRNDEVYIAGATAITVGRGAGDGFVMRLDPEGEIEWHRVLGTGAVDSFDDVVVFGQGSVRLAGVSAGSGVGLEGWYANFDSDGELVSSYIYGTSESEIFTGLSVDGAGMMMVGSTGPDFLGSDVLAVVTDTNGGQPRGYRYAGSSHDTAMAVRVVGTAHYVAGATWSFIGPDPADPVSYRGFVMRLDAANGNIAWQRVLGGRPTDLALAASNVLVVGATPDYGDVWSVGDGRFEHYTEGSTFDGALWGHVAATGESAFLKILEQGSQTTRLDAVIRGLDDKV
ncbi:MAG TPA: hypothetical protein PK095_06210, partial [Myxococcota bacterium]|nr:hypothetical protein [Myxococcota bacterium]